MAHLVATLIYLSQIYSYYIGGDRSPLTTNLPLQWSVIIICKGFKKYSISFIQIFISFFILHLMYVRYDNKSILGLFCTQNKMILLLHFYLFCHVMTYQCIVNNQLIPVYSTPECLVHNILVILLDKVVNPMCFCKISQLRFLYFKCVWLRLFIQPSSVQSKKLLKLFPILFN